MNMISKIGLLASARFHLGHSSTTPSSVIVLDPRPNYNDQQETNEFTGGVLYKYKIYGETGEETCSETAGEDSDSKSSIEHYDKGSAWKYFRSMFGHTWVRNTRRKTRDPVFTPDPNAIMNAGWIIPGIILGAALASFAYAAGGKHGMFEHHAYCNIFWQSSITLAGCALFSYIVFFLFPRMSYRSGKVSSWFDNIGFHSSLGMLGTATGLVWQNTTHGAEKDWSKFADRIEHNDQLRNRLQRLTDLTDIDVNPELLNPEPVTRWRLEDAEQLKVDLESEITDHLGAVDSTLIWGLIAFSSITFVMFMIKCFSWALLGKQRRFDCSGDD